MIRLLTTAQEISRSLQGAMRKYRHLRLSVAWASTGFSLCDQLQETKADRKRALDAMAETEEVTVTRV
jgi:hypothetical protein